MRLILHFDVNKTLFISDPATGVSTPEMVNSIISESIYGRIRNPGFPIHERTNLSDWVPLEKDQQPKDLRNVSDPTLMTFGEFFEGHTRYTRGERKEMKLKTRFTEPDKPGSKFRFMFDQLFQKLKRSDCADSVECAEGLFDHYSILETFFVCLDRLSQRQDLDFRIVFRTFGTDGASIVKEFNEYCRGEHPHFKPTNKLDGSPPLNKNFIMELPDESYRFIRFGPSDPETRLAYIDNKKLIEVVPSATLSHKKILKTLFNDKGQSKYAILIRDDFSHWNVNNESDDSGKLLLVDTVSRAVDPDQVAQVFFDDNIERDRAHIVDVRDAVTYSSVPFSVSKNLYLRRVIPYYSILNPDYFYNEVEEAIKLHKEL